MFSCKHYEVLKNTYFEKHLWTAASVHLKTKRRIQHPAVKYQRCFARSSLLDVWRFKIHLWKKKFTGVDKFPFLYKDFETRLLSSNVISISKTRAWCKSGTRTPGPGIRDPPQSLKVGPGSPLKFKSGTPGPPSKFKSRIPGPPSKFKSGTFIIIFLHCLTYFVLDKYIYNMEIIFHK